MTNLPFLTFSSLIPVLVQRIQKTDSQIPSDGDLYEINNLCSFIDNLTPDPFLSLIQGYLYFHRKQWSQAQLSFDKGLELSKTGFQKAVYHFSKGKLLQQLGQHKLTLAEMESAFKLAGHNRVIRARAMISCGWAHYYGGNYKLAGEHFQQALQSRVEEVKAECWRSLGAVAYRHARLEESGELLEQAREAFDGDERGLLLCENDFAFLAVFKKDYDLALTHYQNCVQKAAVLRDVDRLAQTYTNIAETYKVKRDYVSALRYNRLALELSPFITHRYEIIDRFLNSCIIKRSYAKQLKRIATEVAKLKDLYAQANSSLEYGLKIATEIGNNRYLADLWFNRGLIECDHRYYFAALKAFDNCHSMLKKIPVPERTEEDQKRWEMIADIASDIHNRIIEVVKNVNLGQIQSNFEWRQAPVSRENIDIQPRSYSEHLYRELIPKLKVLQIDKVRLKVKPLAQMLSILQGERFKNLHYTYLGYAWTTATLHLRQLTTNGILEKTGHAKGAQYRLHPEICSLTPNSKSKNLTQ